VLADARAAEAQAATAGLLQGLDPRVKLALLFGLVVATILPSHLSVLAGLFALALVLALASRIPLLRLAVRVWAGVALFSGTLALPALVLVPGAALARLPGVGWPVTLQGARAAAFLFGRAETAATFAALLVLTTPWPQVLKALRCIGVPVVAVALLGMMERYLFLLLTSAGEMLEGRRSRLVGRLPGRERRRLAGSLVGALLARSLHLAGEVHLAMVARGWRGEVRLLDDFRCRARDWLALVCGGLVFSVVAWGAW
jgi:cobalt/nickel transport system permease protein